MSVSTTKQSRDLTARLILDFGFWTVFVQNKPTIFNIVSVSSIVAWSKIVVCVRVRSKNTVLLYIVPKQIHLIGTYTVYVREQKRAKNENEIRVICSQTCTTKERTLPIGMLMFLFANKLWVYVIDHDKAKYKYRAKYYCSSLYFWLPALSELQESRAAVTLFRYTTMLRVSVTLFCHAPP